MNKDEVNVGDEVKVVNNHMLQGNSIKLSLVLNEKTQSERCLCVCGCGQVHLDIASIGNKLCDLL